VDALLAVGKSSAHPQVGDAMLTTARAVSEGGSLSQSWETLGVFPPLWCGMAAVGEASGTLPDVLRRGAAWMDQSVDDRLRKAMSVLEPTMILGVGAVVGGLLVALYHPIFTLPENLMRAR
jgi:type II secretory pathway component PulF